MSYLVTDARLLRINLTSKTIKIEKIEKELFKKFLGGRGLGSKYLADEIDPKIDALSEANKLIFANGLLTGTIAPTGGRYMVVTKSPLTGTIASSNSGGYFGAEFRNTGFMMIIVEGKSPKPVYISINDDDIKINDAKEIWGLNTHKTTDWLVDAFGVKGAKVACIGPAGENLSRIASIMNDKNRAAGRSGVGAVMGSKNLKAIIVKGSNNVDVNQAEKFTQTVRKQNDMLKAHPVTGEGLPALGTKVLDNIINSSGLYPTRNFQSAIFDGVAEVCGEALVNKKYLKNNTACYACVIACGREVVLPSGRAGEGPEYESGWSLGAACGVNDLIAITEANFMCNELGLDTISAGSTIAAAMELYEKGFIPKEDLENMVEPRFGNSEAIVYYLKGMAYRETKLAAKMADGAYRLGKAYGHPELAMVVKKQELPAYDPRGVQGHGLEYATSNRGGCHVRGYMISPEILGVPEKLDPQALEGKAGWVKIFQDLTAVIDSAGLCLFSSFALGGDEYRDLINAVLDTEFTTAEILKTGDRIWNLERKFNLAAGIMPDQDTLPKRLLTEPLPDGPQKGCYSQLHKLLPEYYQLRGWDEKGYIKEETLRDLGLL
ncbi:MAG: aldehyde ferredoxin oxidoreductase family protein [Candidatus Cloacimonetes bacterium]|nr:aldehyde ferredoxin oxidoreductase family protein [Candidatus Cloacimonadota bacterium]